MRSNRGESYFMTDQYARATKTPSSLDKHVCPFPAAKPPLTAGRGDRYAGRMARCDLIAEKLTKAFTPESVRVVDEYHQHAGADGPRPGGGKHYRGLVEGREF